MSKGDQEQLVIQARGEEKWREGVKKNSDLTRTEIVADKEI